MWIMTCLLFLPRVIVYYADRSQAAVKICVVVVGVTGTSSCRCNYKLNISLMLFCFSIDNIYGFSTLLFLYTPYFHLSYNIIHSPCTALMSPALYQCMLAAVNGKTLTVLVVVYFVAKISRTAAQRSQNKPHIVFTLVDNWGFAEAGFRNPAVKTPNFDMQVWSSTVTMCSSTALPHVSPS